MHGAQLVILFNTDHLYLHHNNEQCGILYLQQCHTFNDRLYIHIYLINILVIRQGNNLPTNDWVAVAAGGSRISRKGKLICLYWMAHLKRRQCTLLPLTSTYLTIIPFIWRPATRFLIEGQTLAISPWYDLDLENLCLVYDLDLRRVEPS